jgi:hypothetical protein
MPHIKGNTGELCEDVDWIGVAQRQALVDTAMNVDLLTG